MPSEILDRARALLVTDIEEPPSIEAVARAVGVSRCHLTRAFTKRFGAPPHRLLMHTRVSHACALLERGGGVAEVAIACGFCDQSHLTRWFKKVLGRTPGNYARAER